MPRALRVDAAVRGLDARRRRVPPDASDGRQHDHGARRRGGGRAAGGGAGVHARRSRRDRRSRRGGGERHHDGVLRRHRALDDEPRRRGWTLRAAAAAVVPLPPPPLPPRCSRRLRRRCKHRWHVHGGPGGASSRARPRVRLEHGGVDGTNGTNGTNGTVAFTVNVGIGNTCEHGEPITDAANVRAAGTRCSHGGMYRARSGRMAWCRSTMPRPTASAATATRHRGRVRRLAATRTRGAAADHHKVCMVAGEGCSAAKCYRDARQTTAGECTDTCAALGATDCACGMRRRTFDGWAPA